MTGVLGEPRGTTSGVLESVRVSSQTLPLPDDPTLITVSWTGIDGMPASHAALPKSVCGVPLRDQTVLITEVTDLPGDRNAKRLGFVLVTVQRDGVIEAHLAASGKNFPIRIKEETSC